MGKFENWMINRTLAGKMAQALDRKDNAEGKSDEKISGSIWNQFINGIREQTGDANLGKTISEDGSISLENAIKSITTYCCRAGKSKSLTGTEMAKEWVKDLELDIKTGGKPAVEESPAAKEPPAKTSDIPPQKEVPQSNKPESQAPAHSSLPNGLGYTVPSMKNKDQTVRTPDGNMVTYNDKGYITEVRDQNGNMIKEVSYKSDGSIDYWCDMEYDQNGNCTRVYTYTSDGTFFAAASGDYEYDQNGNKIREIDYNNNGTLHGWEDNEYDQNGNKTRRVYYEADGTITNWKDYEYDQNGKQTRTIYYNSEGAVKGWYNYEYNQDGKQTRCTDYNSNGSVIGWTDYRYEGNDKITTEYTNKSDGTLLCYKVTNPDGEKYYDATGKEITDEEYEALLHPSA